MLSFLNDTSPRRCSCFSEMSMIFLRVNDGPERLADSKFTEMTLGTKGGGKF